MKEIILEKRYPHSREEDITDAFMRGYEVGKEQEHRWWSAFCANCKTENSSEKPNNCEGEPKPCEWCKFFDGENCFSQEPCKVMLYFKTEPITEDCSTVPTISKMEQVEDEPQTERSE